ncbi:MAG: DUF2220 family protein [Hydrogenophaga sp.]|nr:DUF2220 family protein [Hydrogenophaga sp.]MDP3374851.1 DUF2220 family protein [Hydrogenophaga sp.]
MANAFKPSRDLLHFLGRLVDRLDAAELRGAGKAQSILLNAKTWPELVNARFESDKEVLWEEACQLHRLGWIQIAPPTAVRSSSGYAQCVRVSVIEPSEVRGAVGRMERAKSSGERWREALNAHLEATAEVKQAASGYCIELPGHEMAEVVQRLNRLHELKDQALLLREVSARLFWGMSKVLDGRQGLVAAVLGMQECPFPASPVQLLVQLPKGKLRGVLFIENQMSFEQAARSGSGLLDGLALVFSAGFKGSAPRLRKAWGASVFYSSRGSMTAENATSFERWLFSESDELPLWLWGDLDWAGLAILRAMRATFPELNAWQPGYAPMLESLLSGHGHAADAAEKQGQQPLESTGCLYADTRLLPALRERGKFVDQELFTLRFARERGSAGRVEGLSPSQDWFVGPVR